MLREENSSLSASKHALEKTASARDVELSALTQALRDKDELLARTSSHLEAAQGAKRQQDEVLELYKYNNFKLQEKIKASAAEITKGNQIIGQLQGDARALRAKLRLKAAVMLQQQEQAAQKQQAAETADRACSELRAQMAETNAGKERAEESLTACRQQLAEAQELLRSNQQVIQWLNKELNDAQTGQRVHTAGASLMAAQSSRVAAFRPTMPPLPRPTDATMGQASGSSAGAGGDYASTCSKPSATASGAPSSAMTSLRSRAGLAYVDGSKGSELASGFSDFNQYLNPSSAVH